MHRPFEQESNLCSMLECSCNCNNNIEKEIGNRPLSFQLNSEKIASKAMLRVLLTKLRKCFAALTSKFMKQILMNLTIRLKLLLR